MIRKKDLRITYHTITNNRQSNFKSLSILIIVILISMLTIITSNTVASHCHQDFFFLQKINDEDEIRA